MTDEVEDAGEDDLGTLYDVSADGRTILGCGGPAKKYNWVAHLSHSVHDYIEENNPVKTAAAPVASRIFRNALVTPAKTSVYIELDEQTERETLHKSHAWALSNIGIFGADKKIALQHQLGFYYKENKDSLPANAVDFESVKNKTSEIIEKANQLFDMSKIEIKGE